MTDRFVTEGTLSGSQGDFGSWIIGSNAGNLPDHRLFAGPAPGLRNRALARPSVQRGA